MTASLLKRAPVSRHGRILARMAKKGIKAPTGTLSRRLIRARYGRSPWLTKFQDKMAKGMRPGMHGLGRRVKRKVWGGRFVTEEGGKLYARAKRYR